MQELTFSVDAAGWPALEALLDELGALAVTQAEGDVARFAEPGIANTQDWQQFRVTALFDAEADTALIAIAIKNVVADCTITCTTLADEAWDERWKSGWQPRLFSHGLCVCPSWCEAPAAARLVIRLDPGQAFGTGTHESTSLCLDWLGGAALVNQSVIDYGTGSGILAIAAAKLGARRVDAVDIDAVAVDVARENVALNDCVEVITVSEPAALASTPVDVVLANILLEPLTTLAADLIAHVRPGGRLVLAGILATQVEAVRACYAPAIRFAPPVLDNGWALLCGRRDGADSSPMR